jgi:putative peptidoglycan binding protein
MFKNFPLSRGVISPRRIRPLAYAGGGLAVISVAFFLFGAPQAAADADINQCPVLATDYRGGCVNQLQEQLHANLSNDGKFGPKTKQAVVDFQKSRGLTPDGIVGPETKSALTGSGYVNSPQPQPYVNSPQPQPYVNSPKPEPKAPTGFCLLGNTTFRDHTGRGCRGGSILKNEWVGCAAGGAVGGYQTGTKGAAIGGLGGAAAGASTLTPFGAAAGAAGGTTIGGTVGGLSGIYTGCEGGRKAFGGR